MENIFEYVDRLFSIVRPRKIFYLAIGTLFEVLKCVIYSERFCILFLTHSVALMYLSHPFHDLFTVLLVDVSIWCSADGVAPRAKMNQQRSRRFKAAKESKDAKELKRKTEEEALTAGRITQADFDAARAEALGSWHFDSNCITPGSAFMDAVAKSLRWYAYQRLTTNPAWKNIQVIISDANVPGEGEHKIMDYIRHQRCTPNYDPNTKHVLCGLDADLIMLGLATHEPHFYILREFVAFGKTNENDRFAREGGQAEIFHPYQFLRINVLREYLAVDLFVPNLPFEWDLERAIDDYVFLCFFVGNDFLPHMPTLDIREGAIELLIEVYKQCLPRLGGFITCNGEIDLARAEILLHEVGKLEDAILQRRVARNQQKQRRDYQREKQRARESNRYEDLSPGMVVDFNASDRFGGRGGRGGGRDGSRDGAGGPHGVGSPSNQSAAQQLRDRMNKGPNNIQSAVAAPQPQHMDLDPSIPPQSRAPDQTPLFPSATESSVKPYVNQEALEPKLDGFEEGDNVRLGDTDWKSRYYKAKFRINYAEEHARMNEIAREYMEGLVWVLRYYYQGCCSWTWYYPFHYAPFAGELKEVPAMGPFDFDLGEPFTPFEQLMGVLPAASADCLPEPYRELMTSPTSPIFDFYPETFELDLNGKKQAWHAVVLLPFIDQHRLIAAVRPLSRALSESERFRNTIGNDVYVITSSHFNAEILQQVQEKGAQRALKYRKKMASEIDIQLKFLSENPTPLNTERIGSVAGKATFSLWSPLKGSDVTAPIAQCGHIENIDALSVIYHHPQYEKGFQFPARLLTNVTMPKQLLTPDDKKRPALYPAGASTNVILDAVLNSFTGGNRGGRGGRGGGRGGGGRGGPVRHGDRNEERTSPYGGGRPDNRDRYRDQGDDYQGGSYGRREGFEDRRGGGGGGGYNNSNRGGGRGGGYSDSRGGGGGRGGYSSNRGGYGQQNSGHQSPSYGYGNGGGGGGYNNGGRGGYQSPHQQQRGGYQSPHSPPSGPHYSHQQPPPYYAQQPQHQPLAHLPSVSASQGLSAAIGPMLAASAQSLGVPQQPYQQAPSQGSFQLSSVNLQQLYQQQQQARSYRPPY